ncbi:mannitol dehydrogenase family protein [Nonomuraea sp. NPDC049269]|uniref:mannitol dehydrogenase family protein n=1 Tax=Nonomuraea sp. NPDC049269 TaxID=3364349 RepID=UPI00371A6CD5
MRRPVRILHVGLGGFARAHQAWYTHHAPDAEQWGIAAFSHRGTDLAARLAAREGRYTLITRAPDGDRREVVESLVAAYPGSDHDVWLDYWRRPDLAVVTLTITEAGYVPGTSSDVPGTPSDAETLRADPRAPVTTAAARLLAGLVARREAGHGPVAIVPCDNLPGNGELIERVLAELAEATGHSAAVRHATYVSTMVDRITPYSTEDDPTTVVTEPYSEWVLAGDFPAGRPAWEEAGARFMADVTPFEDRKLRLLNGGHSLLAYGGPLRGHETVAEAVADPVCRAWLAQWWEEASRGLPDIELAAYRDALLERFANPRIRHTLAKIAENGHQKIATRVLPVLRAERKQGRLPEGAIRVLAAWLLRTPGASLTDLGLADDVELASAVARQARELA